MFLLYSILFGECCCNNGWNRSGCNSGCGCGQNRGNDGCGCNDGCGQSRGGCNNGCGRSRSCCGDSDGFADADFFSNDCCRDRSCTGFGCHGGFSVCCDEAYYNRQYALCRCKCSCRCCNNNPCYRGNVR